MESLLGDIGGLFEALSEKLNEVGKIMMVSADYYEATEKYMRQYQQSLSLSESLKQLKVTLSSYAGLLKGPGELVKSHLLESFKAVRKLNEPILDVHGVVSVDATPAFAAAEGVL